MKKLLHLKCCMVVLILFSCFWSQAQKTHTVYGELLGNGLFYSVNYEYRLPIQEKKWGVKAGLAPYNDVIFSILQGNYLFGQEKHFFELGLGTTILTGFGSEAGKNEIALNGAIQYRYMGSKGFVFRAGFAPVFIPIDENNQYSDIGKIFWVWPSFSLGYTF